MNRDETAARASPEPEFNPYTPPQAPLDPEQGLSRPGPCFAPDVPGAISITHGLTDYDLRRFVGCDAFYDPMPLFGFIPQWVWLLPVTALIGFLVGLGQTRSLVVALVEAPLMSIIVVAVTVLMSKSRRSTAVVSPSCAVAWM